MTIPTDSLQLCAHLAEPPTGCRCGYKGGIWTADGSMLVCEMGVHKCQGSEMVPIPDDETLRAYACLFAAAPDLLAELKNAIETIAYVHGDGWETVERGRAAIAKAEGGLARATALKTAERG